MLRWTVRGLLGLAVLLVLLVAAVFVLSHQKLAARFEIPEYALTVASDSATIARGAHVATIRGCMDCHGEGFSGNVFLDDPMLGRFAGANLTTGVGGVGHLRSDADLERAIRHGVRPDGTALLLMPSLEYQHLSDEDVAGLIAYLRHLSPVDHALPKNTLGPLGRALLVGNVLPILYSAGNIDHTAPRSAPPPYGPTAAYGAYLSTSCSGCHGQAFAGGPIPGAPPTPHPPANLTPDVATGIGAWTEADFFRAMREGVRPDGSTLSEEMPWRGMTSKMTDDELRALWAYLQSLPPVSNAVRNPNT